MLNLLLLTACNTLKVDPSAQLSIEFKTINTIEGYDHLTRMVVYCDEKEVARSSDLIQSSTNTVVAKFPKGKHTVKFMMEAYDKDSKKWEARTLKNDYSFDWAYEQVGDFKGKNTWQVTFDIEGNEADRKSVV